VDRVKYRGWNPEISLATCPFGLSPSYLTCPFGMPSIENPGGSLEAPISGSIRAERVRQPLASRRRAADASAGERAVSHFRFA